MSSLADYINNAESKESFGTVRIDGSGQRGGAPVEVWYKGEGLTGETLAAKLDEWVTRGCIENGAADAIKAISIGRESIDLSGKHFVLLGAGSAMSPLLTLLRHGATVVRTALCADSYSFSVDRPRSAWIYQDRWRGKLL